MQTVSLSPISVPSTRKMTLAVEKRLETIQSHVLDNPGCSNSDIQKNSGTSNHNDTQLDICYLISTRGLIYIKSTKKYFKEPIKDEYRDYFLFQQTLDDIVDIFQDNPRLQKMKIITQFNQMAEKLNESNIGNFTNTYEYGINHKKSEGEQLLYKAMIIFIQESKIFSSEIKRLKNIRKNTRIRLYEYYETSIKLKKQIISNKTIPNKNSVNTRSIQNESKVRDILHERDWKDYESTNQRINSSLKSLNIFGDFLKKFLMFYSMDSKYLCSDHVDTDELSDFLDQTYDDGKKYWSTLKSTNIKSLKEFVEIQNMIYQGYDENILAKKHGYKNKDTMLKSLKNACYRIGELNFNDITTLQRIQSNRVLVPKTTDEEIHLLAQNFWIDKRTQDMKFIS